MKKKWVIIIIVIFLLLSFYATKKIAIENIRSKCNYIGQEYCFTYDNENIHKNEEHYYFYSSSKNNAIYCIKNNSDIIKINNIEDLENLYIRNINCLTIDKNTGNVAYDENDNETSSAYLKNKMFTNVESNYWDFIEDRTEYEDLNIKD